MPQKNLRLSPITLKQIAALAPLYSTEATVVAVAVQALYDKHTDNVQAVEQEIITAPAQSAHQPPTTTSVTTSGHGQNDPTQ